jgi:hypothetical protein
VATAITVSSYFFRKPVTLRRIQATAALLWLVYGVMIHSGPVIVANVFVTVAAIGSTYLRGVKAPAPKPS